SQTIKSGFIFDINADYEVAEHIAIGVGWTTFSKTSPASVTAEVPHPVFIGQPRTVSSQTDAKHSANAINIDAVWRYPVSGKADVIVSAGPSIVMVSQDVITGVTIKPEAPPFPGPEVDTVNVSTEKKTTVGFNAGVDFAYMLAPRYGVGAGLRYTYASVDIPTLDDSVKAGGLQLLFGGRFRF
ncbi:MAG: outer membrane beta-barrel protein, partial [Acidobacteriota bacterium]